MNAFNERKTAAARQQQRESLKRMKTREEEEEEKRVRSSHDLSRCLSLQYPVRRRITQSTLETRHATCQTFTQSLLLQRQVLLLLLSLSPSIANVSKRFSNSLSLFLCCFKLASVSLSRCECVCIRHSTV
jgi:hypothetical protein